MIGSTFPSPHSLGSKSTASDRDHQRNVVAFSVSHRGAGRFYSRGVGKAVQPGVVQCKLVDWTTSEALGTSHYVARTLHTGQDFPEGA